MSRSSTPPSIKRLLNELSSYPKEPNPALASLGLASESETLHWEAVMLGVPGTAYEKGCWKLDVRVPESYPLAPPEVRFVTPVCHPNVNFKVRDVQCTPGGSLS